MKTPEKFVKRKPVFAFFPLIIILVTLGWFVQRYSIQHKISNKAPTSTISGSFDSKKFKSEDEWSKILTPEQFHIVREKGTEIPFTGALLNNKEKGTYVSVGCDTPVFRSEQKFDSGTGWPSFTAPIDTNSVVLLEDYSLGYKRIEVLDRCGGHLGHVFDDGPMPTGKRYCINSLALKFIPDKQ